MLLYNCLNKYVVATIVKTTFSIPLLLELKIVDLVYFYFIYFLIFRFKISSSVISHMIVTNCHTIVTCHYHTKDYKRF